MNMNLRQFLHTIAALAIALSTGTLVLTGLPDGVHEAVVSLAGVVAFVITSWLGFTTTGAAKA